MKIYIIRHGETDWNRSERWQGNRDIPLNEAGRRQSSEMAEKLRGLGIRRIYTSPLSRAYESAAIIRDRIGAEIVEDEELREIKMGEWTGLTLSEMENTYGERFAEWDTGEAAQTGYGVESFRDLRERAFRALIRICDRENGPLLLVAHGTWTRALMCALLHIPLRERNRFEISNAGMSILEYDKNSRAFKLLSLNSFI